MRTKLTNEKYIQYYFDKFRDYSDNTYIFKDKIERKKATTKLDISFRHWYKIQEHI